MISGLCQPLDPVARTLIVVATLWFAGPPLAAAQSAGDRASAGQADLELSAPAAELQRNGAVELERRARELAGDDEARFTALVRQGLAGLTNEVDKAQRGLQTNVATVSGRMATNIIASELDQDPLAQVAVKRALELAKLGIRMVGAINVAPGEHGETVALLKGATETGCSGVVVAPGAVLTAAHCVCEFGLDTTVRQIAFGDQISSAGRADTIPSATRIFPAASAGPPPSPFCALYKKYGRVCQRDIALVRYDSAKTPTNARKVTLASLAEVRTARERALNIGGGKSLPIEVVGFGAKRVYVDSARFEYGDAGQKRSALFSIFAECSASAATLDCAAYPPADACVPGREIELRDLQKISDSCSGDSGGPAFVALDRGGWHLAALVSRAVNKDGACGPGGIYSYIITDDVVDWLKQNDVPVAQ
jgi:hypothetical protein